jgi:hypothetical protein
MHGWRATVCLALDGECGSCVHAGLLRWTTGKDGRPLPELTCKLRAAAVWPCDGCEQWTRAEGTRPCESSKSATYARRGRW